MRKSVIAIFMASMGLAGYIVWPKVETETPQSPSASAPADSASAAPAAFAAAASSPSAASPTGNHASPFAQCGGDGQAVCPPSSDKYPQRVTKKIDRALADAQDEIAMSQKKDEPTERKFYSLHNALRHLMNARWDNVEYAFHNRTSVFELYEPNGTRSMLSQNDELVKLYADTFMAFLKESKTQMDASTVPEEKQKVATGVRNAMIAFGEYIQSYAATNRDHRNGTATTPYTLPMTFRHPFISVDSGGYYDRINEDLIAQTLGLRTKQDIFDCANGFSSVPACHTPKP